ncbi:MAG: hypothetical protein WC860_01240 [Candidatus Margulisiibacteriota bacterium]|jgi:hypothetical protein
MTNKDDLQKIWQEDKHQLEADLKNKEKEIRYNYKEIKFGGVAKSSPPSTNFPRRNTTDLLLRKNLGI